MLKWKQTYNTTQLQIWQTVKQEKMYLPTLRHKSSPLGFVYLSIGRNIEGEKRHQIKVQKLMQNKNGYATKLFTFKTQKEAYDFIKNYKRDFQ